MSLVPNLETPVGRDSNGHLVNVLTQNYGLSEICNGWVGVGYIVQTSADGGNTWSDQGFVIQGYSVIDNVAQSLEAPHGGVEPPILPDDTPTIPLGANQANLGDPINTADGDVISDATDLSVPNLGAPLASPGTTIRSIRRPPGSRSPQTGAWATAVLQL